MNRGKTYGEASATLPAMATPRPLLILQFAAVFGAAAALGGCANAPRNDEPVTAEVVDSRAVANAKALLAKGEFEDAQAAFARARADAPGDAAAHEGFGDASTRLFEACVANPKRGNAGLYLQDAETGYRRAVEIDPVRIRAWLGAAKIAKERGDGKGAGDSAQRARDAIRKSTPDETKFDVLMALGDARSFEYLQSWRKNESPVKQADLYQRARDAWLSAKAIFPKRNEPVLRIAAFEYSRGSADDAIAALIRACHESTEEYAYQQYLCDIAIESKLLQKLVNLYEGEFARQAESSPTTRWYSGYVKMREAEKFRIDQDFDAARRCYANAKEAFRESARKNADFNNSASQQEAMAIAGEARILYEQGKNAEAAEALTRAFELNITIIAMADGLNITPKATSQLIGAEFFKNNDLARGAEWFEKWIQFSKNDVDWLNNAALMRRDLGEQLSQKGLNSEATIQFETAYRYYSQVAGLMPDEPRLVNDAALMLLYHLNRDLDRAESMFRHAAKRGAEKLDELGGERPEEDDNNPEARRAVAQWDYFSEATGDAWQNLGLCIWKRGGECSEIRDAFQKALIHDPRGTRVALRARMQQLPESGPAPKFEGPLR